MTSCVAVHDSVGGVEFLLSAAALEVIQDELKSRSGRHLAILWQPGSLIRVFQKCKSAN